MTITLDGHVYDSDGQQIGTMRRIGKWFLADPVASETILAGLCTPMVNDGSLRLSNDNNRRHNQHDRGNEQG